MKANVRMLEASTHLQDGLWMGREHSRDHALRPLLNSRRFRPVCSEPLHLSITGFARMNREVEAGWPRLLGMVVAYA